MAALTVRLPEDLHEQLRTASFESRRSCAAIVHAAVEAELHRMEQSGEWTPGVRKSRT
jgi:predicted DNA-binding protein